MRSIHAERSPRSGSHSNTSLRGRTPKRARARGAQEMAGRSKVLAALSAEGFSIIPSRIARW